MFKAVLLTFAALATAQARWSFGWCPEPELHASFDVNQYVGTWYEIRRDKSILFEYGDCVQARYSLRDDGLIKVQNSQFNAFTNKVDDVVGSAKCNGAQCKVGFFLTRNGDYRVLSTDYTNYSVVYSCSTKWFFFKNEYIWVLARTPTIDASTIAAVDSVITSKIPAYEFTNFKYPSQDASCTYLP